MKSRAGVAILCGAYVGLAWFIAWSLATWPACPVFVRR